MKKMILILMSMTLISLSSMLHGAVGCLDKSFHTSRPERKYYRAMDPSLLSGLTVYQDLEAYQPDYKEVHHVWCTCPCEKYKKTKKSGRCTVCRHYGDLDRRSAQNKTEEHLNVPLLEKVVTQRTKHS